MLEESSKMIKDSSDRLEKAVLDLKDLVVSPISPLLPLRPSALPLRPLSHHRFKIHHVTSTLLFTISLDIHFYSPVLLVSRFTGVRIRNWLTIFRTA
jgi:hypothetical protein